MCSTVAMAPGSSIQPHNAMKDKEGGRREKNSQEAGTSGVLGMLTNVDVNRMHVDSNQQSWPALSKSILPPPKKRHHSANQNTAGQPAPKIIYMDCKENKSDRGGSLTSRISSLSPGTKRKMLGYAADGNVRLPVFSFHFACTIRISLGNVRFNSVCFCGSLNYQVVRVHAGF